MALSQFIVIFFFAIIFPYLQSLNAVNVPKLNNYGVYLKKYFTGNQLKIASQTTTRTIIQCASQCTNANNVNNMSNSFTYKAATQQCGMFKLENEKYTANFNEVEVYTNRDAMNSILNYQMVSVGFLYNMADTLAFGDSVICQLDQSWVNKWPSKVLRLAWNSLAYSSDTSTLLVCGGNYDISSADDLTSNECYYAELDGPTNVKWEGPVTMQQPRNAACSVAVNDKIYVLGGGLKSNSDTTDNGFVEVFDTRSKTFSKLIGDLLPYATRGLSNAACLIAIPSQNAFAVTGGATLVLNSQTIPSKFKNVALYHIGTSKWETLPDMLAPRLFHGCDQITMDSKQYLIVYGGQNDVGTALRSISFLDLNNLQEGWIDIPGIQLNHFASNINGGIVKELSRSSCNMMYANLGTLYICRDNFNWTTTTLTSYQIL